MGWAAAPHAAPRRLGGLGDFRSRPASRRPLSLRNQDAISGLYGGQIRSVCVCHGTASQERLGDLGPGPLSVARRPLDEYAQADAEPGCPDCDLRSPFRFLEARARSAVWSSLADVP